MSKRKVRNVSATGLGRTLVKDQQKQKKGARKNESGEIHSTDDSTNQESILNQNSFDSMMEYAEVSGKKFEVVKERAVIVTSEAFHTPTFDAKQVEEMEKHWNELTIPKRPHWNKNTTKEELILKEKESFLEWRKSLIDLEKNDHLCLTPFEKNIEVWRQLWRVVERSQIVVQIVDARNPLFFRSLDLEKYVRTSKGKQNILLVNKADLLTEFQRICWTKYFQEQEINFLFFSAQIETEKNQERVDTEESEESAPSESSDEDDESSSDSETKKPETEEAPKPKEEEKPEPVQTEPAKPETEEPEEPQELLPHRLVGADELVKFLIDLCAVQTQKNIEAGIGEETALSSNVVGMVGYPNVGKSSTINAIAGCKKVQVSQTPGKTKHFQTIILPNTPLTLCDCPGLVFPSFLSTKNEMYCNGLLRIAEIRDVYGPIQIVCRRIPRVILDHLYGISLPRPKEGEDPNRLPTPIELLDRHAYIRGYMNRHGQPDHQRSARVLLTDFVAGKLLYASAPPKMDEDVYSPMATKLSAAGINPNVPSTIEADDSDSSGEEGDDVAVEDPNDFEVDIDAKGEITPHAVDEDAYMNRIKPHGRKTVRREREAAAFEQQSGAFMTGQRKGRIPKGEKKKKNVGTPTTYFPTAVKVTATGAQRTVSILGTTNTPGTVSVTNQS